MQPYRDTDRDSGIAEFENGDTYIKVKFKDGKTYVYTYASAGVQHVETMKQLAQNGDGLNAYINNFVRDKYARKE